MSDAVMSLCIAVFLSWSLLFPARFTCSLQGDFWRAGMKAVMAPCLQAAVFSSYVSLCRHVLRRNEILTAANATPCAMAVR
ncbi:hypothetical protein FGF01_14310 [Aeromonas salmonicida subsp. achromogenes]|uniref:hypothetical protein n=1 Tax=Aeromonas salmonicida TaxID=645 RepID=UPI00110F8004|nr:hypothetical protein [Aeromonas salmonicida]TMX08786.1 hypothetical protein FGF01_14310 [Aeromonas salmonicida subsp. achromogenes]TMX10462.1 hypothetical protein FGE99_14290 [Aeromonas salmonicida subsp. achromogenes]TMX11207.1 hypothetical protein FGF02_13240 [Aeromonas salmonicida subsp. achromogenes]TMX18805.1 hypothetical protein FGF00_14585 [Aeromonas salmonicida subsp. achromogenes]